MTLIGQQQVCLSISADRRPSAKAVAAECPERYRAHMNTFISDYSKDQEASTTGNSSDDNTKMTQSPSVATTGDAGNASKISSTNQSECATSEKTECKVVCISIYLKRPTGL